ncbi:hypothetical protein tooticki91_gp062 [Flavobacterium phage vB_FspS_tooticki9-1]|jgi:hypothetical protein|uniref:Uncharacterized protein n=15 Tax=Caudoviricetes TaxID=2731619 RepID=A0A6B9LS56_9CAUD|nr:hypothetical protein HWC88_gp73 [Flavobacterium phage vB_FspS_hattifnatt9-1]YP_009854795.1 hypothetical protein HWC89_gp67 [Flavobacterium phage vB_FspS_hemulen6-1]YP_009854925.1 hypothetical protein HWC91_gp70 [Flavobacterium phage vB_FspS_lillamy9-1]YP_009854998.1 hypothetical protein HWC92_gp70 [Flavobacterium phage vB_FspS_morran9-1]YP_009855280.1 hypothetical protein HWC96_gp70 [Flavobacterium phage vB_FspS_snork6-1]YP_009855548.1 hypothetical protein HWD00_gp62 [Flavobacterium phage v
MPLYSILDENGFITHCEQHNECPLNATPLLNTQFIKPRLVGGVLLEGATPEEIASLIVVPDSISQMKLRKQLILNGISISSIDALIQSLPQPNRDLIYTMWEYAVVFDRTNPELNAMAQMLEITQGQLDEIFINGNLL